MTDQTATHPAVPAGVGTPRVTVVTGAASGIGRTVAETCAARGDRVVGIDLAESVVEVVAGLPGSGHLPVVADLTVDGRAEQVVARVVEEVGTPLVLVNSAGVVRLGKAVDLPAGHWHQTLDVNLGASFFMAQAVGRRMVAAGYGRIVNLASQAAVVGLDEHVAYCASKAGVLGMTRALSLEWAPHGVTVNAVSPTVVETPLGREAWAGEKGEAARRAIPVGRFAQPSEVAALVVFLASDEAAMITGENVVMDGGYTTV
ncbi:GolD/DthD family dehydrogenase [Desertihabitans aurantiacus]|uniref:GolD/DthD family dehydrogenase n=1 Tax=Desertihabitans aurantiacus TaxID=2282477 RepID=UPI000DF7BAD1|nr:D-threitol dehydrogenase [Desertihabitans aurantiacus]